MMKAAKVGVINFPPDWLLLLPKLFVFVRKGYIVRAFETVSNLKYVVLKIYSHFQIKNPS